MPYYGTQKGHKAVVDEQALRCVSRWWVVPNLGTLDPAWPKVKQKSSKILDQNMDCPPHVCVFVCILWDCWIGLDRFYGQ